MNVTIKDNSDLFRDALPEQIEQALIAIGITAESYAKQALTDQGAVDTGRLRNSITYATSTVQGEANRDKKNRPGSESQDAKPEDYAMHGTPEQNAVYIGTNVEYAGFVETGSSKQKARPYLRPAATRHTDEYKELVEKALKGKG